MKLLENLMKTFQINRDTRDIDIFFIFIVKYKKKQISYKLKRWRSGWKNIYAVSSFIHRRDSYIFGGQNAYGGKNEKEGTNPLILSMARRADYPLDICRRSLDHVFRSIYIPLRYKRGCAETWLASRIYLGSEQREGDLFLRVHWKIEFRYRYSIELVDVVDVVVVGSRGSR